MLNKVVVFWLLVLAGNMVLTGIYMVNGIDRNMYCVG